MCAAVMAPFRILEMAIIMSKVQKEKQSTNSNTKGGIKPTKLHRTIDEVIERLTKELSLKDKTTIANMS